MRPPESRGDRAVRLAAELLKLGISHKAVIDLLMFPLEEVENQLAWLPYRKARRPGAFLIDAVRHHYKPPKEAYYAHPSQSAEDNPMDQDPKYRY